MTPTAEQKEKIKKARHEWYENNKELARARSKAYKDAHPEGNSQNNSFNKNRFHSLHDHYIINDFS